MSTDAEREAIRRSVDIVQYISQYIQLTKIGSEFRGRCVFHEDHEPSLYVNGNKQIWACFACNQNEIHGSDIFGFVRSYFDCSFPEAIAKLQNGNGGAGKPIIAPPRKKPPPRELLIPPDGSMPDMEREDLGGPVKVWTIRTRDGKPWFYEARYLVGGEKQTRFWTYGRYSDSDTPRWECKAPTNPRPFWGLEELDKRPNAQVMIHEAPKKAEAARLLLPGVHLGIVGGVYQVAHMDLAPLEGRRCILLPDNDEPGRHAMSRLAPLLWAAGAKEVKGIDPDTQPDGSVTPIGWDVADSTDWTPQVALAWAKARKTDYAKPDAPSPEKPAQIAKPAPAPASHAKGNGASAETPAQRASTYEEAARAEVLGQLVYTRISDVQPEAVQWLWPGRIPLGELTMIVGDPGLGKSQICASLASVVTNGGRWPVDRTQAERGSILILSAEDNIRHTIRPRLDAAGADVERCHTLQAVRRIDERGNSFIGSFSLAEDLAKLGVLMQEIGDVRLVIIDPVSAYLGETDSHKNAEVRGMLAPLTTLAGDHHAAIILVSHLTKSQSANALMRVQGSIAFAALCRAVWGVTADKDDRQRRLFMPLKNNLGQDKTGLAYAIEPFDLPTEPPIPTSRIMWEAQLVETSVEEAFGAAMTHDERTDTDAAKELLLEVLADGRVKASDVQRIAKSGGHSLTTLGRAKRLLKVESKREGFGSGSVVYWQLHADASDDTPPRSWTQD